LPSGNFSVAVLSAMVGLLGGAQARHDCIQSRVIVLATPGDDVPQVIVRQVEQRIKGGDVFILQCGDDALKNEIQLEQAATAFPLDPISSKAVHQTERITSNPLMWLMAFVVLRYLEQTSNQFMQQWQRHRP